MLGARTLLVQEISKNLCRHDNNLCIWIELDVAGHNTHTFLSKHLFQVIELLIAQGLDRSCIEDATTLSHRIVN